MQTHAAGRNSSVMWAEPAPMPPPPRGDPPRAAEHEQALIDSPSTLGERTELDMTSSEGCEALSSQGRRSKRG